VQPRILHIRSMVSSLPAGASGDEVRRPLVTMLFEHFL
jgi:hypothetical protein